MGMTPLIIVFYTRVDGFGIIIEVDTFRRKGPEKKHSLLKKP
jgi:hypothetical protein